MTTPPQAEARRGVSPHADPGRPLRLYWVGVGLVVAGLFVTQLLPCVDYPQHLALSDVARRLQDPAAPEQAEFQLNYFTYNGLFHVLVALLSTALPIELAGRLVVAGSLLATAAAVPALLAAVRRPPEYAALFLPVLFSFAVAWGFVNYVLATAVAVWALVAVARAATRPTVAALGAVAVLGLACAFAHVLAMLILCAAAAAVAGELAWRGARGRSAGGRLLAALGRATLALAPLLAGCVFCIAVYRRQYDWDPNMYRDPTIEGIAPPLWQKLLLFSAYATDLFNDVTDQILAWVAIVGMAWATRLAWKRRKEPAEPGDLAPPMIAPFVVLALAYLATPMVLVGTHLIFPRLAEWVVLGAVLAMPRFPVSLEASPHARAKRGFGLTETWARRWIPRLGVAVGINTLLHCALFGWETRDASATLDDLPAGGAATAVVWDPSTAAFRNGALTHLAGYYAARKHGRWAFAFARYLSVPVRFKAGSQHGWPAVGWEYDPRAYDPRCPYAREFPLVIVKAPANLPRDASGEPLVRSLVFHDDAPAVSLLSHHGRYWAFDSSAIESHGR